MGFDRFRPCKYRFLSGSGFSCRVIHDGFVPSFDPVLVIVTICYLSIMGSLLDSGLPSGVGM
jgi:hypothetical protein